MLYSIAFIFLLGMLMSAVMKKLKLPGLLGMILTGIVLSPYALNLLDESILGIAPDLRRIALVIILTRAGLSLNLEDLKRVGRPAILMCFVPAAFEIMGTILIAPKVLGISMVEAAILGSVIAAVSPAVIVPRMIRLIDEGYGKKHSIPQLILAGASVDDVFVLVLFTAFTSLATTGEFSVGGIATIPVAIILGIVLGFLVGILMSLFFKKIHIRDSAKVLILLSISFLMLELETRLEGIVPVSGLLAVMSMSIALRQRYGVLAVRLSAKYNKLWVGAEIMLFVLVGAAVDLHYVAAAGVVVVLVLLGSLIFRMVGVLLCLVRTEISSKERAFCVMAYMPKATVQAAIGAVPLSMGLSCGQIVLTAAVLSILITAPLGAILVDNFYKRLLNED